MHHPSPQEPALPNPALHPLRVLIGIWQTTGTHGQLPGTVLHGHTSFAWLEHGAFVLMRSQMDDPRVPRTIAILGSDDAEGTYYLLTCDERGVSRKYDMSWRNNLWQWWRHAPGFLQRYAVRIAEDGNSMIGRGELSTDGVAWEPDLDLTYTRIE